MAKFNNIEYWNSELEGVLPDENMSTAMDIIEQELSDYPTLIYDGPYSDHILEAQPQMTANAKAVTEKKAKQSAARISGVDEEKLGSMGTASGHIDTFVFGNDDLRVTVSRFGGFPVYMRRTRAIDESHIDYEQALKKAHEEYDKYMRCHLTTAEQDYLDSLDATNPDTNGMVQENEMANIHLGMDAASSRLSTGGLSSTTIGRSAGDGGSAQGSMWTKVLYNKSKMDSSAFD